MKRLGLFLAIVVVAGFLTHSLTGAVLVGAGTAASTCLLIGIGGIIDLIIAFAGGQAVFADKIIAAVFGKR